MLEALLSLHACCSCSAGPISRWPLACLRSGMKTSLARPVHMRMEHAMVACTLGGGPCSTWTAAERCFLNSLRRNLPNWTTKLSRVTPHTRSGWTGPLSASMVLHALLNGFHWPSTELLQEHRWPAPASPQLCAFGLMLPNLLPMRRSMELNTPGSKRRMLSEPP